MTKEICGPFSVQSQSDSPSTEYGNLRARLPRSRTAAQGLRAKPGKAEERLDSITPCIELLGKQLDFLEHCLHTVYHISMFGVPERHSAYTRQWKFMPPK